MKKNITKVKIVIILLSIIIVVMLLSLLLANIIRMNKINNQALNNINIEQGITTLYCNGQNIILKDDVYKKLKQEKIDLLIINSDYIAKIDDEHINNKIDVKIKVDKDENLPESYFIETNTNILSELKINTTNNIINRECVSQFYIENDKTEFINNDSKIQEDKYVNIELKENISRYLIAYIIPEEINVSNITINKGTTGKIDLGIEESKYTMGSIDIESSSKEAVEVDNEFNIIAKEVGEYKIYFKSEIINKEVSITVLQSAEKIVLSKSTLEMLVGTSTNITATVIPNEAVNKELNWTSSDNNIATVDNNGNIKAVAKGNCEITVSTTSEPIISEKIQLTVNEKKRVTQVAVANSNVEGITYINGILLVNKNHPIPSTYAPGLLPEVYNAFLELKRDAATAGHNIELLSGYRSYETQKNLYNNYVATYGQAEANTFSARPGTSEHQTGLAMDVGWIDDAYGDTPSGKWLAENCYKYGFIIRYMKGKENITGYKYEPWHIRYLGKDIAKDVYESGLCLEEYLGVN